ncbi:MAG: class I SAM-dependent methyltransferase [Chloroflexi bacterium AL-N10]|nr:class I SAM-dependent methyltransferase [Chloroflexi bacterium AL-N1]NOK69485.1 class I SAM-dependent methyltransferase [Chloroflexi bacterium AL-N10]NOK77450.1 class I SAM-dependent methyltransferase [Chloroflexi bacterium AL-N5]NOK91533.1 class I SAM-dependent methyltransferase [Chloroflexi bacterium AL-N15]
MALSSYVIARARELQESSDDTETISRLSRAFTFACPRDRTILEQVTSSKLRHLANGTMYSCEQGIWRLLAPERTQYYERFLTEYETIRHAEGRGSTDTDYYRALPFADLTGQHRENWHIRACGFETLIEQVVEPLETRGKPLKILDIGAGNGWLSYRLAQREHHVASIDLSTDPFDGLGTHTHYNATFVPVQAEFDRLPFAANQFDLVIFNASLHYSTDYMVTLNETLRVLQPDSPLVILDSPVYRRARSGQMMVHEREHYFEEEYGFPSNALPSENYLTYQRLRKLANDVGLDWQMFKPEYGLAWSLRPWKARLRGRREPAKFMVIVGWSK